MSSEKIVFDRTKDGKAVYEFVITRPNGESFSILTYGALIHTLKVFDKNNKLDDVMLGFDTIDAYMASGSGHGSIIGRTANRIKGGAFEIDGVKYQMPKNEGENNLHGGAGNFQNSFWEGEIISRDEAQAFISGLSIGNDWTVETEGVLLSFLLADGVCGVPGNMDMKVLYTWTTDGTLVIAYKAKSDKKTIFAPTTLTLMARRPAGSASSSCGSMPIRSPRRIWTMYRMVSISTLQVPNSISVHLVRRKKYLLRLLPIRS